MHCIRVAFNVAPKVQDHLLLAVVAWFLPHQSKHCIGKPAQVWQYNQFECGGFVSFVPVNYLSSHCAHCVTVLDNQSVLVVVPLVE